MEKPSLQGSVTSHSDTPPQPLPEDFLVWQRQARRTMLESIASGGFPCRHPAHLPIMITFDADHPSATASAEGHSVPLPFLVRTATKGVGLTPRDAVLGHYLELLQDTLARCDGRPWDETLTERVAAVGALLDHPEDIDCCRLGALEIFRGHTYANLHRDPRVILHFTGDGPDYLSFQINGYARILGADDPRYRYIALCRQMFEEAPFHLQQPGYVAAYLVEIHQVLRKTPYVVPASSVSPALSVMEAIEAHLPWTPEASARMERVPAFVRGVVRTAIEQHAREQGRTAVDESVVLEARQRFGG